MKGTVIWYNSIKGYGFIQCDDDKEAFVHRTAIPMDLSLNQGDEVQFDLENSERGPKAVNVKKP